MSSLFEILPNLYISTNLPSNITGNIISINNQMESIDEHKVLNINVNLNNLLIKSKSNELNIDFDLTNTFITNSYKNKTNTIIISDNLIVPVIMCINFIMKSLNCSLIESLYFVCKKTNINYKIIPPNILYKLFYLK